MDLRLCHHPCSPGDSVMDCEHNQYRRSEAPGTCRCHHLFCAPVTLRGESDCLLSLLKLSGKARPRQASMVRRFPYLLLRWLAVFECVNESDEKGESENVARVSGGVDVHSRNNSFMRLYVFGALLSGLDSSSLSNPVISSQWSRRGLNSGTFSPIESKWSRISAIHLQASCTG